MEVLSVKRRLMILLGIFILIIHANVGHCKDAWWVRRKEAKKAALQSYNPAPVSVMAQLNEEVQRSITGVGPDQGASRYSGLCVATNPIDQCWRCQPHWARNRQTLADCVLGFGGQTTGGKYGSIYVVTNPSDDDVSNPRYGTLRHAVIQPEPLWIIFRYSMVIRLKKELIMTSNKTIDGRGAQVFIAHGAGITLQYVTNVIIHGLHIYDIKPTDGGVIRDAVNHIGYRNPSDGDGISIFGSSNIWIDHVSLSTCSDGLIDVIHASTAITISNCYFTLHNKAMLFGAHDSDSDDSEMQITVAFNHFGRGLVQRMPRVRLGLAHVVNNDYTEWLMYAVGGSQNPTIISHGNHFAASNNPHAKEVTKRESADESEWNEWVWKSEGDVFENGAFFRQSGDVEKFSFSPETSPVDGSYARYLTRFSGALKCIPFRPC